MALTLAQDWTGKNGEVKAGSCGDPGMECLRYSQRLFLFTREMVSDPRQKHCIVSTRCSSQYIYECELTILGKRGFSDCAMLVSFP
jgi:hypothetical protein